MHERVNLFANRVQSTGVFTNIYIESCVAPRRFAPRLF